MEGVTTQEIFVLPLELLTEAYMVGKEDFEALLRSTDRKLKKNNPTAPVVKNWKDKSENIDQIFKQLLKRKSETESPDSNPVMSEDMLNSHGQSNVKNKEVNNASSSKRPSPFLRWSLAQLYHELFKLLTALDHLTGSVQQSLSDSQDKDSSLADESIGLSAQNEQYFNTQNYLDDSIQSSYSKDLSNYENPENSDRPILHDPPALLTDKTLPRKISTQDEASPLYASSSKTEKSSLRSKKPASKLKTEMKRLMCHFKICNMG
ncbi:uncharacterized protein LOC125177656 [Hyalella azteca]|uniref:Uncharacterized protein LOC125177656 n=1 Tax=Hyalella azteca TaxID=294128 RepID=A0A979FFS7_HYAAZ|nr:uncharacterized protein LOC125177656 [Hyalella azteca]